MSFTPDDLLADEPLTAAVAALAERNRHHLADMSPAEREDALEHWREIAVAVLTAARAALEDGRDQALETPGRAVIVDATGPKPIPGGFSASFRPVSSGAAAHVFQPALGVELNTIGDDHWQDGPDHGRGRRQ